MDEKYRRITEIKSQTDEGLTQLSEGEYRSPEGRANNLAHLKVAFNSFSPYLTNAGSLAWLNQHNPVVVSEIAMTGRAVMALHNFFRVVSEQPR